MKAKDWIAATLVTFILLIGQAYLQRIEVEEVRQFEYSRGFDDGWESKPTECSGEDAVKWWTGETDLKAARAKICSNFNKGKPK